MSSVQVPDSSEVGLHWDGLGHLVGEDDVLWQSFREDLLENVVLLHELLSSLFSGGVDSEVQFLNRVSVSEGVEEVIFVFLVDVSLMSEPVWFWNFVVEVSCSVTLAPVHASEPVQWVWLYSFSEHRFWSHFREQFMSSLVPCRSREGIDLPAVPLFSSCPLWNSESLEEGSRSSVEVDISDSFEEGRWVEVLLVQMMVNVVLLVELVVVEVFDSNSYIILNLN